MERLGILLNRIDLSKCGVTQNDRGWYYGLKTNPDSIAVTTLAKFDTWTPPNGYVLFKNGSHTVNPGLWRIDFRSSAGSKITFDKEIKVNGLLKMASKPNPYGVQILRGDIHIDLNHTHLAPGIKVGSHYPAGTVILIVNTQEENKNSAGDFPPHLEIYQTNGKIRDLISQPIIVINPIKPKVGTLLKWNTKVNLRDKSDTSGNDIGEVAVGEQQISKGESSLADNYEWVAVKNGFAIIQDMKTGEKFVTEIAPPEDPKDAKIRELEADKSQLEKEKIALNDMIKARDLAIDKLEKALDSTQQERNKYLSDCHSISALFPVVYDPILVWKDEGEVVGQHYTFEGAIATIKTNAVKEASTTELISAIIAKFFTVKHGK